MTIRKTKLFALVVAFSLLAVSILPTTLKVSAATAPAQLVYAKATSRNGHIISYGYVQTQPTSGGSVVMHYTTGTTNIWKDVNATYVGVKDGTYGLWYFEMDGGIDPMTTYNKIGIDFKFAIKFTNPSGQVYWDNNNTANYKVSGGYTSNYGRYALSASNLVLSSAYSNVSDKAYLSGQIALKNLAYTKVVKVRYTTDNWATYKDAAAAYQFTDVNGVEVWSFKGDAPLTAQTFKFAVSYNVNGVTYWDNNFGANYTVNVNTSLDNPGLR